MDPCRWTQRCIHGEVVLRVDAEADECCRCLSKMLEQKGNHAWSQLSHTHSVIAKSMRQFLACCKDFSDSVLVRAMASKRSLVLELLEFFIHQRKVLPQTEPESAAV